MDFGLPDMQLGNPTTGHMTPLEKSSRVVSVVNSIISKGLGADETIAVAHSLKRKMRADLQYFVKSLISPQKYPCLRLPLAVPRKTAKFTYHRRIVLTPNADGRVGIIYQPRKVSGAGDGTRVLTELEQDNPFLFIFNNDTLTDEEWTVTPSDHEADATYNDRVGVFYERVAFRGAGIYIQLSSNSEDSSGIWTTGVNYHYPYYPDYTTNPTANPVKPSVEMINDASHAGSYSARDGLRHVLFPLSEEDLDFYHNGNIDDQRSILIFGTNLHVSSSIIVNVVRKFEAIPFADYHDYVGMTAPVYLDVTQLVETIRRIAFQKPAAIVSTLKYMKSVHGNVVHHF